MKRCFKCRRTLPLIEFYRHPMMADGHLNKCRACARKDSRKNRRKNREYYNAYDRARHGPGRRERLKASRAKYPERHRARWTLHNAVRDKRVTKQPCEVCKSRKAEAHHEDYSKPLKVRWLCRKHHGFAHRIGQHAA